MRLILAGTPEPALPVLHALLGSHHEVVAVLTRPDAPKGRGRTLHPSPVSAAAQEAGVRVLTPRSLRDPDAVAELARVIADEGVDAVPVVAYGNLVPPALLDAPRHGWLNLHFSLLPAWRGAAPVQHAIRAGDTRTGASVFRLEAGLDTGPVFDTVERDIAPTDTSGDLLAALAGEGAALMLRVLDGLEAGTAAATPQPEDGATLAPKIEVADARVDLTRPAADVDRLIRATTPAPGAWTADPAGRRLKLRPVRPLGDDEARDAQSAGSLAPAEVRVERRRVLVGTGAGIVELGEVAPAGKSWMAADAWARGARLEPGARLGTEQAEGAR